ncbi:MAG: hypothetical protein C5B55_05345 [Blastocatellia bacterium]|nr:MAG: hypothetical protein C5B55_05345 [Blastocatellia bacterium]
MRAKPTLYWLITSLIVFAVLSGGVAELVQRRETVEGMLHLGYPLYFISILGVWKVLGAIALLIPRFPRLKEWAYAGIVFNMTGAAVSHAATGDNTTHIVVPLVLAVFAIASWALRPPARIIGALPGPKIIQLHTEAAVNVGL